MNLECLNDIITDGLGIQIDISDIESWDLNTGLTSVSLSQWSGAKSDNINLYDFGLTAYDNGRVDRMYSGLTLTPNDLKTTLYRVGYNTGQTVFSGETQYDLYPLSGITGESVGNYFEANGGYLQGFFKLKNYNYEVFPSRYNNGITIETLIRVDTGSTGIFFLMGLRAEDKYNPEFSGESQTVVSQEVEQLSTGILGQYSATVVQTTGFTGVQTSEGNYLNAYQDEEQIKEAFANWETNTTDVPILPPQSGNTQNNIIAVNLTADKKLNLLYIDGSNLVRSELSSNQVGTGWTWVTMTFTPDAPIDNYDPNKPECFPRRTGTLKFYVNGREFWKLTDFDEFYFRGIANDKEKQSGVPYNISFGGGSFGLKHSWHYDYKTYPIYSGESQEYIESGFTVTNNPLDTDPCFTGDTGGSYNSLGLVLTANTTTFEEPIDCSTGTTGITVMEIQHTGATGTTLYEYFIEYDVEIDALSNRDLTLVADIYDTGIFNLVDGNGDPVASSISLIPLGDNISAVTEVIYGQPISAFGTAADELGPFPTFDGQIYQYEDGETGLLINGQTGYPVIGEYNETILDAAPPTQTHAVVNGTNEWHTLQATFRLPENSGLQTIKVGILLQSTEPLIDNFVLYVKDFKYIAPDKLVQDETKDNLLIEQNFDSSYIGGIQKLRIYDNAFNSQQVLHNVKIELINNPAYGYIVSRGGRIIYR